MAMYKFQLYYFRQKLGRYLALANRPYFIAMGRGWMRHINYADRSYFLGLCVVLALHSLA